MKFNIPIYNKSTSISFHYSDNCNLGSGLFSFSLQICFFLLFFLRNMIIVWSFSMFYFLCFFSSIIRCGFKIDEPNGENVNDATISSCKRPQRVWQRPQTELCRARRQQLQPRQRLLWPLPQLPLSACSTRQQVARHFTRTIIICQAETTAVICLAHDTINTRFDWVFFSHHFLPYFNKNLYFLYLKISSQAVKIRWLPPGAPSTAPMSTLAVRWPARHPTSRQARPTRRSRQRIIRLLIHLATLTITRHPHPHRPRHRW